MHSTTISGKRGKRLTAAVVGVAATAAVLGGIVGVAPAQAASSSKTLTVAAAAAPVSLDPALQNVDPGNGWFIQLGYDPLIRLSTKGKPEPDLATSWKYTDSSSKDFVLTLRKGVKFNDGTAVTADAVVKSLQYFIASGVNGATWLGKDTTVSAPTDNTVEIKLAEPNSTLPYLLTQRTYLGSVISPKGMADTTALKSGSYGAGPYMIDASETTPNDTYTYVKNPNYWDKSKQHWNKVVLKVAGSTSAALQAVENGDADLMRGDITTATAAASAGLKVEHSSSGLYGVGYLDRAGTISKPLANKKVREALSLAIDRKSITQAVWGDLGTAGNDLTLKGFLGFDQKTSNSYAYNLKKAKALLKSAGYAKGFSFPMQTTNLSGADVPAQAIVQDWAKIGVKAKLTVYSDNTQLINDTLAKKYAVGVYYYGAQQQYLQAKSFFNGGANQYNPFNSQDAKSLKWLDEAAASSSAADQQKLYQKVLSRAMVDNVWFSNVAYTPSIAIYRKGLKGMSYDSQLASPDVAWSVKP
jgi:peptide/nickel transport system substrate-binding protein